MNDRCRAIFLEPKYDDFDHKCRYTNGHTGKHLCGVNHWNLADESLPCDFEWSEQIQKERNP